jgi:predicted ATPase
VEKMLKKLTIRNFKAIQDMTIEFTPLTVLIGENGCGKSTILQALDFLCSVSSRDIPEYLRERGWSFDELKSQANDGFNKPVEFISLFEFKTNKKAVQVEWFLFIDLIDTKWNIREEIRADGEGVISYGKIPIVDGHLVTPNTSNPFKSIKLESSLLKIADDSISESGIDLTPITMLQDFFSFSSSYELLSPQNIRNGLKNPQGHLYYDIGINGEVLAQCIDNMSETDKQLLNKTLSELTGQNLSVGTMDYGNKIKILLNEKINDTEISVNSSHISDGLLRFIAFSVISQNYNFPLLSYTDQRGLILLDEIEDGINPYLTDKIINLLRVTIKNSGRQIIVTTHSPVILNDFNHEEIVFLWKDKNGSVHSRKFFETEEMKSLLEALNPGEVWINLEKEDILERLSFKKEGKE